MIGTKSRVVSLCLKGIVIFSAAVGVILSAISGAQAFMGGGRVFMYFTIQSNIVIALVCAIGAILLLRNRPVSDRWYLVKYVFTVSITLTGVVFCFVLAPTLGKYAWSLQHVLTHVVVPVAAIVDFFVTGKAGSIKKRSVPFVTIPPLLYAIYTGIAYAEGWEFSAGKAYPYFFLNWGSPAGAFGFTKELPYMGCAWWILLILVLLLAVGYGYLLILGLIKRKSN
ncbi:MAG: Pr6Pr family membrane protein [Clostridia bacterium]|nr:Pr6Pr family membrane protein [Clostridia bacterium]